MAWLDSRAKHNRRQRQAIQQIWRMGGGVAYVGGSRFEQPPFDSHRVVVEFTAWLNDAIDNRTARKLIIADDGDFRSSVVDDDIPRLVLAIQAMPELEEVRIRNTGITRDGVNRMRRELPDVDILLWSTKPSAVIPREVSDTQRLKRELLKIREHFERRGYDESKVGLEIEEFRSIWLELSEFAVRQPTPKL
ncbi:hypothetical protein CEE69_02820 [Rhodopirellula bahusiensis]|uniref:Uncharacterized protein n=2 Tax=Rhodopirellula bahusiensis TaxID=2014065 RepID=A0A2G1WBH0_9BACT|nr:hypothetical protein CEE69_02820 [Rhodopirellula bahusiensis]